MRSSIAGHTVELVRDPAGADLLAQLGDDAERALVVEVTARPDTSTLIVRGSSGQLMGYAVLGRDDGGMVAVYAARALDGCGFVARAAMAGIFGASQVLGAPLRFHAEGLEARLRAAAKMMGAAHVVAALDADGLPQGVFHGL